MQTSGMSNAYYIQGLVETEIANLNPIAPE